MSVEDVMAVARRDTTFYSESGGGVTFGGGEATLQKDFLLDLLRACQAEALHTCLETCGFCDWSTLEQALPLLDLVLLDLKHMDPEVHLQLTGVSNARILDNAARLGAHDLKVILRLPLIPGLNDSNENIQALGRFAAEHGFQTINVIPYHLLGVSKYAALGRPYLVEDRRAGSSSEKAADTLASYGLQVSII
jgi:pyruvate formate lyase activating enzyme